MTLDDREIWVTVDGFPDYAVSNYGNVVNVNTDKYLKPRPGGGGYLKVALRRNNETYERYVHTLVAKAFFVDYREGLQIGRIDQDRTNNSVWNLRMRVGTPEAPRRSGPRWGHQVKVIEMDRVFRTVRDCAKYIGGDYSSIYACLRGKQKTHLGYTFEYVEE